MPRLETQQQINDFFSDIKNKTSKQVKKIKRLAMKHNIPLRELRKTFCKKCFSVHKNPKIRVKKRVKSIICEKCGYISRWKVR